VRPGRPRALWAAAALAVCSLGCLVGSFFVRPVPGRLIASGRYGPGRSAAGRSALLKLPNWLGGAPRVGTISISFSFADRRPEPGQAIVRTGTAGSGLTVGVEGDAGGARFVLLRLAPWTRRPLRAVLVSRLVPRRSYEVRVALKDMETLTAWVDGRMVASYDAGHASVGALFRPVVIGEVARAPKGAGPLVVSDVTLSFGIRALAGSDVAVVALLSAAGMAGLGLVFLLVVELAAQASTEPFRRLARLARELGPVAGRRGAVVGMLLLLAGGAVLELVTPPEDAVVRQLGVERLDLSSVPVSRNLEELPVGSPTAHAQASSVDETLRFLVRFERRPRFAGTPVVTTKLHGTGIAVDANPDGSLVASVAIDAVQGGTFLLGTHLPLHRWLSVVIRVVRSRELVAELDGVVAFEYTYASPVWKPAPSGLEVGARGDNLAVRDLSATTVLYGSPATGSTLLLVRLAQAFGFVLVAAGSALVAARLLRVLVPSERPNRQLVRWTFGIAAAGIALNLLVDALHLQHAPALFEPRNTWLFAPDARFSDFLQILGQLKSRRPYGLLAGSYPPVGYFLLGPFVLMQQFAALLCFLALFAGIFSWWLWRSFAGQAVPDALFVSVVAFASYPVSFAIDRANVDLFVFVLLLVALAAIEQRRDRLGAILIGLAGAAKIFPGLYALVFLRPLRRWRYGLLAALTAAAATIACFFGLAGSLAANLSGLRRGLHIVELAYGNGVTSTITSVTVSSFMQAVAYAIGGASAAQATESLTSRLVVPEEVLCVALLVWYLWRREPPAWRAVTLVTVAVLVLPQVSYAYELLYLFIPLALFVRQAPEGPSSRKIAALFGLLLAPKSYLYLGNSFIDSSVLFNAPLLCALVVAVMRAGRGEQGDRLVSLRARRARPRVGRVVLEGSGAARILRAAEAVAGAEQPREAHHSRLRPGRPR
jgi:hypothetical protein